jgi:predicted nuclease with RNAse H fold
MTDCNCEALRAERDAAVACADRLLRLIEVSVRRYTEELERTERIPPLKAEIRRLQERVRDLMEELEDQGILPPDLMVEPEG